MLNAFRSYYDKSLSITPGLPQIKKREFGFASFEGWMLRHKGFSNENELASFLRDSVPRDAYVSCAYYENPESEMEKKGWLGADLVFDIDADHISTVCDKTHDEWTCNGCGFAGRGAVPEKCPVCGGARFEGTTWPCPVCLASAKTETIKLLGMLTTDFGFSEKDTRVFFSGHRGYHVHVELDSVKALDSIGRKEIVDYVLGLGLTNPFVGSKPSSSKTTSIGQVLSSKDAGWRRRIAFGIRNLLLMSNDQDLLNLGIEKNMARTLLSKKDSILKNWDSAGNFSEVKGVGLETWRKLTEHSAKIQSAEIDTVVTTDVHRLIRLPATLHGKTGFKKIEFSASDIDSFDPFKNAIAFKGGVATVFVSSAPQFKLCDETFGPYRNQRVELPTAAAVLLVCKGRAEVVE